MVSATCIEQAREPAAKEEASVLPLVAQDVTLLQTSASHLPSNTSTASINNGSGSSGAGARDHVDNGRNEWPLLTAFSAVGNVHALVAVSASRKFTSLEGLRVICMLWIILGHTANFMEYVGFDEPMGSVLSDALGSIAFNLVIGANFAVDVFFLLSGFLGAQCAAGTQTLNSQPWRNTCVLLSAQRAPDSAEADRAASLLPPLGTADASPSVCYPTLHHGGSVRGQRPVLA